MSRSTRKRPYLGIGRGSEKTDKRIANRKFRKRNEMILKMTMDDSKLLLMREVSNRYTFKKDCKRWINPNWEFAKEYLRK